MTRYEYRVLPAPAKGVKVRGARTTEARFANALMQVMNEMGAEGWEYQRTDTLPCEERVGLTGRATRFQNMLVFRRVLPDEEAERPALPFYHQQDAGAVQAASDAPAEEAVEPAGEPREDSDAAEPVGQSVASRLAATLSGKPRAGIAAPSPGTAPGNGLTRPEGGGVAVE